MAWIDLPNIVHILEEIRNILYYGLPKRATSVTGKTFGFPMVLNVGDQPTKIYFSRYNENENVPVGTNVFAPHRHFKTIIIINDGPADLKHEVNGEPNEARITSLLRAGEGRSISSDIDGIKSFFCYAVPGTGPSIKPAWGNLTTSQCLIRIETLT